MGFKEHFVKYDDNPLDDTVIIFDPVELTQMMSILELSIDFTVSDYYHIGTETHYLKTNLYQRMLNRADTEEKKERIKKLYPHLANNNQQG